MPFRSTLLRLRGALMLPFQWNALRVGERVMVHDDLDPGFGLDAGTVRRIQTRQRHANEIGIRLDRPPSTIVHPRRHAVHLLPIDPTLPCWRCDAARTSPTVDRRVVA